MPGRRFRLFAAALIALATVIIVVAIARQAGPPVTTPTAPPASRVAPDFEITMYQGQDIIGGHKLRLSQILAQGKPVVLNFFAGLCPPCRAEMPDFQKRYVAGGKDQYVVLALDIGPYTGPGSREQGKDLLRLLGITFPAGTVFDEDILAAYQIFGMPSTFFITPKGIVIRKQAGLLTGDQMDRYISDLLEASRGR
jgi:thiol-disulfide isomerase/thioredoxin